MYERFKGKLATSKAKIIPLHTGRDGLISRWSEGCIRIFNSFIKKNLANIQSEHGWSERATIFRKPFTSYKI